MTSWYTRPPSTQGQANGESHVLDPLQINAVTYQQEAVGNHLLDLNKTLPVPYAPNTPNKFSEVVSGSPDQVVGLAQASDPGGAQASFISLLQQNAAVMQASYTENPLLSNGKISDPYMLSGYHQTPSPRGSFSIQYKNNIYYSPEATARVAATRIPPFPFAFSMQNSCQGINDNTLKTNAVGVTSPPFDSRVTQSGSPMSFDRSHLSHSGTSSFSFFKPIGQTSLRTENTILDLNETNSIPSAPITPEKMKISTHNPAIEVVNLVDDPESGGSVSQRENFEQVSEGILKISSNQDATQTNFSSMGISLQQTENQMQIGVEDQGIDLNKTPHQKPRKKKHRPKVIKEGKPAKKSKQATPKSDGSVIQRVKRKYVRKKGCSETPSNTMETTPETEGNATQTVKCKYACKKGVSSSENPFTALEATVDDSNTTTKRSAKRSLNFDSDELQAGVRSHNCSLDFHCAEKLEGDLDRSANIPSKRSSIDNFSLKNSEGAQELVQPAAPNVMFDLNDSVNEPTGCCTGLQGDSIPTPQPFRREILKQNLKDLARKRVSLEVNRTCLLTPQSQLKALNNEKDKAVLPNTVMADKINSYHNHSDKHAQHLMHNTSMKKNCDNGSYGTISSASSFTESPVVTCGVKHDTCATELHGEHMLTFDQTERKAQLSMEPPTQVTSFTSLISGIISTSQKLIPENQILGVPKTQVTGPSKKSMPANSDPIDMLILKLKHLTIEDSAEHPSEHLEYHNALVPYNGQGPIVPVEGLLDFSRRRRPRPKVDLDSETNRVWMLLMGKEGIANAEGTDKDKEKWWEEQRKVFRGRVESFIARMHQVQGDRRFSPWKGSVVDSVVGVFLTQNVSDVLSSSAFMSLAARFPAPSKRQNAEVVISPVCLSADTEEECMSHLEDGIELLEDNCSQQKPHAIYHERQQTEAITATTDILLLSGGKTDMINVKGFNCCDEQEQSPTEMPEMREEAFMPASESTPLPHSDFVKSSDSFFSSQSSVISSQNSLDSTVQSVCPNDPNSETGSEVNYVMSNDVPSYLDASSTSFTELLKMAGTSMFQELYHNESRIFQTKENLGDTNHLSECVVNTMREYDFCHSNKLGDVCPSSARNACHMSLDPSDYAGVFSEATVSHINRPNSGCLEMNDTGTVQETLPLMASNSGGHNNTNSHHNLYTINGFYEEGTSVTTDRRKVTIMHNLSSGVDVNGFSYPLASEADPFPRKYSFNFAFKEREHKCLSSNNQPTSYTPILHSAAPKQQLAISNTDLVNIAPSPSPNCRIPQHVNDSVADMATKKKPNIDMTQVATDLIPKQTSENVRKINAETEKSAKAKKGRPGKQQNSTFDWDGLRKQACSNGLKKERSSDAMDSVDWEAIRNADVKEISDAIRERGMNNMLAERIKDFLDRLVKEHGSIDLEWLRDVPPEKAKDYLLSIRGLGLKSVECVRLLTLHNLAFPVDTNVGRICVRLGWVPLQPLPESLQLHLLELYPLLETIQKYLWPRLCTLDQRTLYELHYQLITFGKVFCTKSKPNCNACPMRAECKHFASAFASARLALPAPEEKGLVTSVNPIAFEQHHDTVVSHMPPLQLEGNLNTINSVIGNSEPIIEEPPSPEPERIEYLERDIEDAFYEDPDDIPTIHLNIEEFTHNLQNVIQENNMQIQDYDMSKALVALMPNAAAIPQPKLKNVNRLRTEHQVYELPDSHPLLEGLDQRETDDPCPYLLAIWSPGETADSIEPPRSSCNAQEVGKLCDDATCPSCNSIREADAQKVRGTLLIPCRTAMRGSFPLNGTYFQVNEVFADHASSLMPIDVPRQWIWNLPRRTVYFGTSVPTIFRGLTTQEIQYCFWRGFVCVRGFDQKTRAPRPLIARLHFPASKMLRNKKGPVTDE